MGKLGITCPVSNYFSQLPAWWENKEVFPMENFPREILSASFLFPDEYKPVQRSQAVQSAASSRLPAAPGLLSEPGTGTAGGRWRPKRPGHAGQRHLGWAGSGPGTCCWDGWEAERHDSCPQRPRVSKANSAGLWVCKVWLHRSYCDPCYSGILQNRTNSHKSFAE